MSYLHHFTEFTCAVPNTLVSFIQVLICMVHCDTCISVLLRKCYRTKPTKLSAIFFFEFWIEVADVQEQISFSENSKNIYLRDIIRYHPVAKYMIDLQSQLVGPWARCLLRPCSLVFNWNMNISQSCIWLNWYVTKACSWLN